MMLPVHEPFITSYPTYTALFTMIELEAGNLAWAMENLMGINAYYFGEELMILYGNHLFPDPYWINCPSLYMDRISTEMIPYDDLGKLIQNYCDHKYYAYLYYDRQYVASLHYTEEYAHDLFLYGYDGDWFYGYDFLPKGSGHSEWQKLRIPKEEINRCFYRESLYVYFFKKKETIFDEVYLPEIKSDKNHFREKLIQFIEGYLSAKSDFIVNRTLGQGLGIYDFLHENINRSTEYCDVRLYHSVYSHKMIWKQILNILKEQKILKIPAKIIDLQDAVCKESLQLRNSVIKQNLLCYYHKGSILQEKTNDRVDLLKRTEERFLLEFKNAIQ